jgi:hypothetical protein
MYRFSEPVFHDFSRVIVLRDRIRRGGNLQKERGFGRSIPAAAHHGIFI